MECSFNSELVEITAFRVIKDHGCPNLLMSSVPPIVSLESTNQSVFIIEMLCVCYEVEIGRYVFAALNSSFRRLHGFQHFAVKL